MIIAKDRAKNKYSYKTLVIIDPIEKILKELQPNQEYNKKHFGNTYNNDFNDYICVNKMERLIKSLYHRTLSYYSKFKAQLCKFTIAKWCAIEKDTKMTWHSNFSTYMLILIKALKQSVQTLLQRHYRKKIHFSLW